MVFLEVLVQNDFARHFICLLYSLIVACVAIETIVDSFILKPGVVVHLLHDVSFYAGFYCIRNFGMIYLKWITGFQVCIRVDRWITEYLRIQIKRH